MEAIIEELSHDVLAIYRDAGTDKEVQMSIRKFVNEIRTERNYVLREDGYEDWLMSYVQREAARFPDGTDAEDPRVQGAREERVCFCADADCPLKRGRLPRAVRKADDIDAGITEFKRDHRGYPIVLAEAKEQYAELLSLVQDVLSLCLIAGKHDIRVDELPDTYVEDETMSNAGGVSDVAERAAALSVV